MKHALLLVAIAAFALAAAAQPVPQIVWTQEYADAPGSLGWEGLALPSGDLVMIGGLDQDDTSGLQDEFIILADADGEIRWATVWGGEQGDCALGVDTCADGGFIVAGWTAIDMGDWGDLVLTKVNTYGTVEWTRNYDWGPWNDPWGGVRQTPDGGYLVAGVMETVSEYGSRCFLFKTDADGDSLWCRQFARDSMSGVWDLELDADGNAFMAGNIVIDTLRSADAWVIKYDPDGNPLWQRFLGDSLHEAAYDLTVTPDGGCFVAGSANSFDIDSTSDNYILRLDADGNVNWWHAYGVAHQSDEAWAVTLDSDGGCVIGAHSSTHFARLNPNDPIIPNRREFQLMKLSATGDSLWTVVQNMGDDYYGDAHSLTRAANGDFVLIGDYFSISPMQLARLYYMRFGQTTSSGDPVAVVSTTALAQNYPNPFNPVTAISFSVPRTGDVMLEVFDLLGRQVATLISGTVSAGEHTVPFDGSTLASGRYYYRLTTDGKVLARTMLLLK